MDQFWDKVDKAGPGECWEWQGATGGGGYGQLTRNGEQLYAHRLSAKLAEIPTADEIRHTCDNPACVNPEHLRAGTHGDNMQDSWDRSRSHGQKLTEDDVCEIRRRYEEGGVTQYDLADEYGVSQDNISSIVRRKTWQHV